MRSQYYPSIRIKRKSWQQQSPLPPIAQSAHLRSCAPWRRRRRGGRSNEERNRLARSQLMEPRMCTGCMAYRQKLMYDSLATRTCPFVLSVHWRKSWLPFTMAEDHHSVGHYEERRRSGERNLFWPLVTSGRRHRAIDLC